VRTVEKILVAATMIYVAVFVWRQTPGLFDRQILEWDARAMVLPAWRYHGTGLFPNDLVVDLAARYDPPGWKAIYWVGTLFTDPFEVGKLLPFALLAFTVWQAWCLGRRFGGRALACATVIVVVHCTFVWNRMMGGHARSFGYPLVIALLRYAAVGAERRALMTLVAQPLFYPSAFVFCAPAWALSLLRDRRRPDACRRWLRFAAAASVGLPIVALSMFGDPRLGNPPTRAQAATLAQMQIGGAQPYWPLQSPLASIADAAAVAFRPDGETWKGVPHGEWVVLALLLVALLLRGRRALPPLHAELLLSSLAMFALAYPLAFRLYLPNRMLLYAWPPILLALLPVALAGAFERRLGERAPVAAAATALALVLLVGGDGLPRVENLTDFRPHFTPTIRFCATLPKDTLIATHPERSTYLQTFALRRTLFSASLNVPFYYEYALEMERRIGDFYRAYYARSLDEVVGFARKYGVEYLILDERDFGPDAISRAAYYEPWGTLARTLLQATPPATLALAHPPPSSVVFRDGDRLVLDARKLQP